MNDNLLIHMSLPGHQSPTVTQSRGGTVELEQRVCSITHRGGDYAGCSSRVGCRAATACRRHDAQHRGAHDARWRRFPSRFHLNLPVINVPTVTPIGIPPVAFSIGAPLDSLIIGSGSHTSKDWGAGLLAEPGGGNGGNEWRGSELMMRIISSSPPAYPEQLRRAGISGQVLVRFEVDTLGRVDPSSVVILESTHELLSDAVRRALQGFRFHPAEVAGRRVRAAAQMPFEFQLVK